MILTEAIAELSLAMQLEDITRTTAKAARLLANADGATFVLRDGDKCFYADENAISPLWKGQRFPLTACISGWSMLNKETVKIRDIYQDDRIPHNAYRPTFVKSLCMVPIRPENPLGSIGNYWKQEYTPTSAEVKVLQVLANSTAIALENLALKSSIQKRNDESESLRDKNKELEAAMFSLAHDLRSPIGAMAGLAEIIRLDLPETCDPSIEAHLNLIFATATQANDQVERMLSLYRVTNGKKLEKKHVDLTETSHKIIENLRRQSPQRTVNTDIAPQLTAFADSNLIHLALENLLTNAVKYSGKKPFTQIQIGREESSGNLETFFVRDNGDGFEPSQAYKLFRPLSRLHASTEFAGTGLGLFSVAKIIELHGGKIWADAVPREGATFFFTLPTTG